MKKFSILLLMVFIVVGVAVAKPILRVQAIPYALNNYKYDTEAKGTNTRYGFGGSVIGTYPFKDSKWAFGLELNAKKYNLNDIDNLNELAVFGELTFIKNIKTNDSAFYADFMAGVAYESFSNNGFQFVSPAFGLRLGADTSLDNNTRVNFSIDTSYSKLVYEDYKFRLFRSSVGFGVTYLY